MNTSSLLAAAVLGLACSAAAAEPRIAALIVDGANNHDWQAGTRAIRTILEGTGRFTVDVCTFPDRPKFSGYQVVINNFNGGHTATSTRWPREVEQDLAEFVRKGGGVVVFHAANNAFLEWPEYNEMIGLGWRPPSFGRGIAIGNGGEVISIPKGAGLPPGHGPRHDFTLFVRDQNHPITHGLPAFWTEPSEQLTHGQHGPAEGLTVLTYAYSEVSRQGEPMDWVRQYGKGRVYTTMLGHTWKDQSNPNLDNLNFQALLARGTEWAATGRVTLAPDLGWKPIKEWETRGTANWVTLPDGTLFGNRVRTTRPVGEQAWTYTKREFREFDLHVEYFVPPKGNSGVSIRDTSRAHGAIGEPGEGPKTTPAHVGYEIQIIDGDNTKYPTGSIYLFVPAKTGIQRPNDWNTLEIESRDNLIRVRVNNQVVAESPGDPARPKSGPIGLQLHDQFTTMLFRNIRIRER